MAHGYRTAMPQPLRRFAAEVEPDDFKFLPRAVRQPVLLWESPQQGFFSSSFCLTLKKSPRGDCENIPVFYFKITLNNFFFF